MDMRKYLKRAGAIAVIICLFLSDALVFSARAEESEVQESGSIICVALGDSIAKGYAGRGTEDLRSYPELLMEKVSEDTGIPSECRKYAKNGLDAEGLNTLVLPTEEVLSEMETADVITLTIGANDLLKEFKETARKVLGTEERFAGAYDAMDALTKGIEGNPFLIVKLLDVLNNWDYGAFEEQWVLAVKTIARHRKESSQFLVTNIYNPISGFKLPENMNQIVGEIILNMNEIMYRYAEEYHYGVVDLFSSDICDYLLEDGLHPGQEGQELIAELVAEKTDTGRFTGEPEEKRGEEKTKEETEHRRPARRRFGLWNLLGPVPFLAAAGAVFIFVLILCMTIRKKRKTNDRERGFS